MAEQFLVHLPDGKEYGPIDRATLERWWAEGRLAEQTLVWPHGAPEWLPLSAVVVSSAARGATPPAKAASPAHSAAPAKSAAIGGPAPKSGAASAQRPVAAGRASDRSVPAAPVRQTPPSPRRETAVGASGAAGGGKPRLSGSRAGEGQSPPTGAPPDAKAPSGTDGAEAQASPRRSRPSPAKAADAKKRSRTLLMAAVAAAIVLGLLAGLWVAVHPIIARNLAVARVQRYALLESHLEDRDAGLVVDLPAGWVALAPDNPLVPAPEARLRLAQPWAGVFATLAIAARPRAVDALDAYLDELVQQQVPRRPSIRKEGRAEVQLGRGRGRLVRTAWEDGFTPMQGATVAWSDGYAVFSLDVWGGAEAGRDFTGQVEALCRGLRSTGVLETRMREAAERLELEVPELPPDVLRLLVGERMSQGRGTGDLPTEALRVVSRGLDVLTPSEAAEMREIYQQVWAPLGEADRVHMASLLGEIRAGRDVSAVEVQVLRDTMKAGVFSLPIATRGRLQDLSGRAARRALAKP